MARPAPVRHWDQETWTGRGRGLARRLKLDMFTFGVFCANVREQWPRHVRLCRGQYSRMETSKPHLAFIPRQTAPLMLLWPRVSGRTCQTVRETPTLRPGNATCPELPRKKGDRRCSSMIGVARSKRHPTPRWS